MSNWWNRNAEARLNDFKAWIGESSQPSKVYCRKHIAQQKYRFVIDCGCGLATDYFGFKEDGTDIYYVGVDSCKYFVTTNRQRGITMIEAELEKTLPIIDNYCDVTYCREVLEHLSHYEKTLAELIRISKKEVLIVFFIKPDSEEEKINYWEEEDLYHNKYNKEKLEKFILNNPKVSRFYWQEIQDEPYVVEPIKTESDLAAEAKNAEVLVEATDQSSTSEAVEEVVKPEPEKPTGEKIVLHIVLK